MIKTITLDAGIEKRVRGRNLDEIQYDMESINLTSAGVGIKVSRFLKAYGIDSEALIMSGFNIAEFVEKTMQDKNINATIMETPAEGATDIILIDQYESCAKMNEAAMINDEHVLLFSSLIVEKIKEEDVVAFEYNGNDVSEEVMASLYEKLCKHSGVQICDLHPKYWSMMEHTPANVLIVDEKQCMKYLHKNRLPLSQTIELIQEVIVPLSKIVIYTLQFNDILIFVEGNIYRVVCSIKNSNMKIFKEALISGVIKCYVDDGDIKKLSEECMSMSVGTSISEGLYVPDAKALAQIKEKVVVYSL